LTASRALPPLCNGRILTEHNGQSVADGSTTELEVDGAFVAIGQVAATNLAKSLGVALREDGFVAMDTAMSAFEDISRPS